MRERGVAHNDLAKEPNWLQKDDGEPAAVDFQIAWVSRRQGRLFRLLVREDLRHLLKHKRTYCPQALTPIEKRVLARRSWIASGWRATGKRAYKLVARRLFGYWDNEGKGRVRRRLLRFANVAASWLEVPARPAARLRVHFALRPRYSSQPSRVQAQG
jgi:hypothetical protein